ncbi:MAG: hypothetical protein JWR51_991 [Devosia sp.]|uniref:hypothetical protein n=1 Tax=Devosia sp. TaxID=1871048 RepID=UPI00260195F0|nr:hypothetical protein [Devosia sp.]MDB5527888.1 hypothetical protein [Devosia sp.]
MRNFLVPAAIALVLGTSGIAMAATAAPQSITSTVKTFDAKTHMLTLANNIAYVLPANYNTALKAGQKVTVKWEMNGAKYQADSIAVN